MFGQCGLHPHVVLQTLRSYFTTSDQADTLAQTSQVLIQLKCCTDTRVFKIPSFLQHLHTFHSVLATMPQRSRSTKCLAKPQLVQAKPKEETIRAAKLAATRIQAVWLKQKVQELTSLHEVSSSVFKGR